MQQHRSQFEFEVYNSIDELNEADAQLLQLARQTTANAYAPYSNFYVAAVALLEDGTRVKASNQENASYPVGICAERVLLSAVASQYPDRIIESIAISYDNRAGSSSKPVTPCGLCRQSLLEYETRQGRTIKLILGGLEGNVYIIPKSGDLLPLNFNSADMK